jgi:hypothetical protein
MNLGFYLNMNHIEKHSFKDWCMEVLVVSTALKVLKKYCINVKLLLRKLLSKCTIVWKIGKIITWTLAFSSLLIAREMFEEVQLGFLVVGHTHEDIDGNFGYLSKN